MHRNNQIKVVIVDDHQIVRQGIESFLALQPRINVVGSAENSQQLLQQLKQWQPDVVLLDLQLNDGVDGIAATRQVKQLLPDVQVVILTSFHQDSYVFPAFAAGALSYLIKDIAPDDLVDAIVKAADKQAVFSPLVANKLLAAVSGNAQDPLELSPREHEVLTLIAEGLSNAEIGEKLFIHIKTVRTHVSNILSKLQVRDRTQAAVHAWRSGLMD